MADVFDEMNPIIEAALFTAAEPLSIEKLAFLFEENNRPSPQLIKQALQEIAESMSQHGVELVEVASGYRFQAKAKYAPWLQRLQEKKPARYSRAFLETLALVVYRQPISRGEIEEVRGVAVSTHIMKTLLEHEWVKVVGHRDMPGKPALYGTTKKFLDYFNLKSLTDLPPLHEVANLEEIGEKLGIQLNLDIPPEKENPTIQE